MEKFTIHGETRGETELLPLLVIINFPCGKLAKTMIFNIYREWYFNFFFSSLSAPSSSWLHTNDDIMS